MIDTEKADAIGRELLASGHATEEILATWRERGLSILHSIQSLSHITGMPLAEAKTVVHCSRTWSDLRTEHDRLHDELEKISALTSNSD